MNTPYANDQLSAYLDGELSDQEIAELEASLQSDAELRAELEALESATDFFRTHAPTKAPAHFVDNVLALVEHEPAPANDNSQWWRRPFGMPIEGIAVAAAALLVVGVTLNFGAGTGGQVEADPAGAQMAQADPTAKPKAPGKAAPAVADAGTDNVASGAAAGMDQALRTDLGSEAAKIAKDAYSGFGDNEAGDAALPTAQAVAQQRDAAAAKEGAGDQPKMRASYSYTVTTDNPEIMAGLLRAAGKYQGFVENDKGQKLGGDAMDGRTEGSFFVHIPAAELARFGDELRSIGVVQEIPSNEWFGAEIAKVRVDIRLLGGADEAGTVDTRKRSGPGPAY